MPSITIWNRLEPRSRTAELTSGLAARVPHPLWLPAREWQVGEFAGCDSGSPLTAHVQWTTAAFDRYASGTAAPQPYNGNAPLEALIEGETVRPTEADTNLLQAAEAGLHFLRLLDNASLHRLRAAYVKHYPLAAPGGAGGDARRGASMVSGRALNGIQLRADLAKTPGSLPAVPALTSADAKTVLPIAKAWIAWFDGLFSDPGTPSSWTPGRMEYSFAIG